MPGLYFASQTAKAQLLLRNSQLLMTLRAVLRIRFSPGDLLTRLVTSIVCSGTGLPTDGEIRKLRIDLRILKTWKQAPAQSYPQDHGRSQADYRNFAARDCSGKGR